MSETGCSVSSAVSVSAHINHHSFGHGRKWKIRFRSTFSLLSLYSADCCRRWPIHAAWGADFLKTFYRVDDLSFQPALPLRFSGVFPLTLLCAIQIYLHTYLLIIPLSSPPFLFLALLFFSSSHPAISLRSLGLLSIKLPASPAR